MRSHPTPSFTTEPHSMTYLIHPPVSSFRVCCCYACSFMLIQSCTSPTNRAREREGKWERHKCFKELKKHYSFSNCFRHSKYSNICTSPSLFFLSFCCPEVLLGSLRKTCWGEAEWKRGENIGGRAGDLGGDRERGLYVQGQVRVQGSWWHQLRLGGWGHLLYCGHILYLFRFQLVSTPLPARHNLNLVNQDHHFQHPQRIHNQILSLFIAVSPSSHHRLMFHKTATMESHSVTNSHHGLLLSCQY